LNLIYTKQFNKDIKRLTDKSLKVKIKALLEELKQVDKLSDISGVKKLQDAKSNYFRIKVGDYRLGLELEANKLYLLVFRYRKDIYKNFP
jgi:mRNA interferase RelE/StbE